MIQFLALFSASAMLGTSIDIENGLPLLFRIVAGACGVLLFVAVAYDRDPGFERFKASLKAML